MTCHLLNGNGKEINVTADVVCSMVIYQLMKQVLNK